MSCFIKINYTSKSVFSPAPFGYGSIIFSLSLSPGLTADSFDVHVPVSKWVRLILLIRVSSSLHLCWLLLLLLLLVVVLMVMGCG